jgi:peptide deformylase
MAIRPLAPTNDPVLRNRPKKVRDFGSSLQDLIEDMVQTMHDAPGVGLAAPQVGVSLRVAVIELPEEQDEEEQDKTEDKDPYRGKLIVICNPEVVKTWGAEEQEEGCLSVPQYVGEVTRATRVVVKAQDRRGKPIRLRAEGLMARVLQHEIDHLNGMLFVDRVESLEKLYRIEPSEEDGLDEEEEAI